MNLYQKGDLPVQMTSLWLSMVPWEWQTKSVEVLFFDQEQANCLGFIQISIYPPDACRASRLYLFKERST
jgi:hypothetical protein